MKKKKMKPLRRGVGFGLSFGCVVSNLLPVVVVLGLGGFGIVGW